MRAPLGHSDVYLLHIIVRTAVIVPRLENIDLTRRPTASHYRSIQKPSWMIYI